MLSEKIYWDANASSKTRPIATKAFMEVLGSGRALNPSSVHQDGQYARSILREARNSIVSYLGFSPNEVELCFVSGGSEASNSLVTGFLSPYDLCTNREAKSPPHVISSQIEHVSMLEPLRRFVNVGVDVTLLAPDKDGFLSASELLTMLRPETELVSIMTANNETGAIQDIAGMARMLRNGGYSGAIVSDACQAPGKSVADFPSFFAAGLDVFSVSAHKMGSIPGIGALIFNKTSTCRLFEPLVLGGSQEGKKRGGTEFVAGAAAWGAAASFLKEHGAEERIRRKQLRNGLYKRLKSEITDLECVSMIPESEFVSGSTKNEMRETLDNTLLLRIPGCRADDLTVALDLENICVSMGSACSSGKQDVSHVLTAMGRPVQEAREFLRISIDWDSETDQIECGANKMIEVVTRMRRAN